MEPPPPTAAPATAEPEIRFRLTAVTFDKSHYLRAANLDALVKPLLGREVTIADLNGLVARVNALYARRNIATARAALPAQNIAGGSVQIRLIEGRIGVLTVDSPSRRARAHVAKLGIAPGDYADPEVLERRLKRFNLENDAQLRAQLAQGQVFGTTDLTLLVTSPKRLGLDIFSDNNGFAATGTIREGAVLRAYRIFGSSDRASAVVVHSRGVQSESSNYSTPILDALRGGLSLSSGTTDITQRGTSGDVAIHGTSLTFGGDVSAVLIARRRTSLIASALVNDTRSTTDIAGKRVLDNRVIQSNAVLTMTRETPGLVITIEAGVAEAHLIERVSEKKRDPILLRGNFAIAKAFGSKGLQARVRGDWQESFDGDLPGLLQYQIGGARSVRAFAPGIAAGDSGFSVSGELGWTRVIRFAVVEPLLFIDHAQSRVPGHLTSLDATGPGLNLTVSHYFSLRADYAFGLDHHGLPHGADRGYLSGTLHF